jgi:predicted nucleotidyltransferase component of viral defense system
VTDPTRYRPTHRDAAGRTYLGLRARAKTDGRSTAEYLRLFFLEGILLRMSTSPLHRNLILKGGALLSAYDVRRPTVDLDFVAIATTNDVTHILDLIRKIAMIELPTTIDDGVRYVTDLASADTIRESAAYAGVRVTLRGRLATARETFHVDVNVGDPIWPSPQLVQIPRLLGGTIELLGYSMEMVLAEKS